MASNPMQQFTVHKIGPEIKIAGIDLSFTNASLFMLISALTIALLLFFGSKNKNIIPNKIQLIAELIPNFGTIHGGTLVDIISPLVVASSDASCSIGGVIVRAVSCIPGKLTCRTPPVLSRGTVSVRFLMNGDDFIDVPG